MLIKSKVKPKFQGKKTNSQLYLFSHSIIRSFNFVRKEYLQESVKVGLLRNKVPAENGIEVVEQHCGPDENPKISVGQSPFLSFLLLPMD